MNFGAIIMATVVVAAVGLFIGIFLGVAGKRFAVDVDEREVAIREALPGNNCGGCGLQGSWDRRQWRLPVRWPLSNVRAPVKRQRKIIHTQG